MPRSTMPHRQPTIAIANPPSSRQAAPHEGPARRRIRFGLLALLVLLLGLLAAGCGGRGATANSEGDESGQPLQVVTTIGQITDIARIIGGDHVEVTGLMGPGIDPHLYVASEGDVALLQEADIIFYNGLILEAQLADVLAQLGERKPATAVAEGIDPARLRPWEDYENQFDPHVWFDVTLWMEAARAMRDTYSEVDPAHAEEYAANAEALLAEMEELHAYVQEQAQRVPEEQRVLITGHDAFQYFGAAYDFEVRGLQGISTASEASAADVRRLADFIVERQIPAVFIETSVPVRSVEALQAAVGSRGYELSIGGELYSDAMGDAGTPEGTYIGMVRYNVDTIVEALLADSGTE